MQLTWGHFSGGESTKKFSNNGLKVNGIIDISYHINLYLKNIIYMLKQLFYNIYNIFCLF